MKKPGQAPAFPSSTQPCEEPFIGWDGERVEPNTQIVYRGISVRDYFAAKALAGMLSNPASDYRSEQYAHLAYALADEMLKERSL